MNSYVFVFSVFLFFFSAAWVLVNGFRSTRDASKERDGIVVVLHDHRFFAYDQQGCLIEQDQDASALIARMTRRLMPPKFTSPWSVTLYQENEGRFFLIRDQKTRM